MSGERLGLPKELCARLAQGRRSELPSADDTERAPGNVAHRRRLFLNQDLTECLPGLPVGNTFDIVGT